MAAPSFIELVKGAAADLANAAADAVRIFVDVATGEPSYKDESGTVTSLRGDAGADAPPLTYQDHGNTGSTETVDASAADVHRLVANAATVTLTLSGAPASGTPAVIRLWLEQDGTGGRDWAFPGSVDFGDPGEPDWTTRAGGAVDLVDLMTVDGGTTWVATVAGREGPQGPGAAAEDVTFDATGLDNTDAADVQEAIEDLDAAVSAVSGGATLLAAAAIVSGSNQTTTSSTQADVDATNVKITFTAPASGKVLVKVWCAANVANAVANAFLGLREGSTDIVLKKFAMQGQAAANVEAIVPMTFYVSGISAGSHTYKLAFATNSSNTFIIRNQSSAVEIIMEVWAAP